MELALESEEICYFFQVLVIMANSTSLGNSESLRLIFVAKYSNPGGNGIRPQSHKERTEDHEKMSDSCDQSTNHIKWRVTFGQLEPGKAFILAVVSPSVFGWAFPPEPREDQRPPVVQAQGQAQSPGRRP